MLDAQGVKAFQVKILHIVRRGFEHHLKLEVALQTIGIFAVAAVRGRREGST